METGWCNYLPVNGSKVDTGFRKGGGFMQKIINRMKELIQEVSGMDKEDIEIDGNLFSLGLDSLMLVQIKKRIDQEFQVELPMGRIMSDIDTVEKIAGYLSNEMEVNIQPEENNFKEYALEDQVEPLVVSEVSGMQPENLMEPFGQQTTEKVQPTLQTEAVKKAEEKVEFTLMPSEGNVQGILEMQMRVMAESLRSLAQKQLEIVGRMKIEMPVQSPVSIKNEESIMNEAVQQKEIKRFPETKRFSKTNKFQETKKFPEINFRAIKLDHEDLTEKQKEFVQTFIERYNNKTKKSKKYASQNRKQFCDWIASLNFRTDFKELIYPIVSARSQGSKFWDLDGNQYLDMAIGYGVHYFGHRPQFIVDAIQEQIAKGYETGPQTNLGGEVSRLLCKITGAQRAAFCNTGSEAVMAALRIARTVNKKPKIVMFRGAYHGNFDSVLAESLNDQTFPTSPGTMYGMVEDVIVLDYAKEESLQIIKERGDEIAAVIVEPVQSRNPGLQPREFLHQLRHLTEEINAALIFDEMITGFRICLGGCQEYFGVHADMATYGKIVGGGLPIGIVAGKAKYLDAVDGGYWNYQDDSYPEKEMTFFAGTFCKHPLSMAASKAVLEFMEEDNGAIQREVNQMTEEFVAEVNRYFEEEEVPMHVNYFGSEFRFEAYGKYDLKKLPAEIELFFYLLMEKGIYIWEKRTCFFSAAHTREDAQLFLNAIKKSVKEMRAGGFSFTFEKKGVMKKNQKTGEPSEKECPSRHFQLVEPTKAQERYYLLGQMRGTEKGTHLTSAMVLTGPFMQEKVTAIFQKIVDQQEALRTCYSFEQGELMLRIYEGCDVNVEFCEGEESRIETYIEEFVKPFDMSKPPLMHVKVIKLGNEKHLLMFDIHHSVSDGYSCTLITKHFMELYEGNVLTETGLPFRRYKAYQAETRASKEHLDNMKYWKEILDNKELAISFPENYQREAQNQVSGKILTGEIDSDTLKALKNLAKEKKCSLYHVLFGAFSMLLYKTTWQEEFVVGTPVQMRGEEFMNTVGYLTNTCIIYNNVKDKWTLGEYLEQVKRNCALSLQHCRIPFADLIALTASYQKINHNPIFDTMFVYENGEERVNHIAGLECEPVLVDNQLSIFDMTFEVIEERQKLSINVTYKTSLYKEDTVAQILGWYVQLLTEMVSHPDEMVSSYLAQYTAEWEEWRKQKELLEQFEERSNEEKHQFIANSLSLKPEGALVAELVECWKECLHVSSVDTTENFFDMGGRSIDAMNLIDKLKKKYSISIMDFFKYPTIEKLAQKIQAGKQDITVKMPLEFGNVSRYYRKSEEGQMPVAIIGMAGRFPKSKNVKEFWKNLEEERECIQFFKKEELLEAGISEEELSNPDYVRAKGVLENAECFDAAFFEYSPKEAEKMDPQIRIMHECAWNALEDAGYAPGSLQAGEEQPQNIGVFAGIASNYTWMSRIYEPTNNCQERIERIALNDKDYTATRISYKLNLKGPSYGVQTACSSSLTSIHLACRSLELGECEMALAGGVSIMLPDKTGYLYEDGMILSKDGHCRVFDKDATGTIFSDGAGMLLLKPLNKAIEDKDYIYAVIRGTASNNDGRRKAGYTAPSIDGQAEVIRQALDNARIDASTISYVEAHGTGTHLGDPIEVEGLKEVYPKGEVPYCALGSLKSNFGHMDAAAGVAGVMKAALALKHHKIPASIYCENPNPQMHLEDSPFYVPNKTLEWKRRKQEDGTEFARRAGVTSLGFGGTNAHVVLEEYEDVKNETGEFKKPDKQLFVLSARTKNGLNKTIQEMSSYLEENPEVDLNQVAYALQMGRKPFAYRKMLIASSIEELRQGLEQKNRKVISASGTAEKEKVNLVFLFTGQGCQYVQAARELYEKEIVFRAYLDECFDIAGKLNNHKVDYKAILYPDKEQEEESSQFINETQNAQMILFMLEYSMTMFLIHLGIQPDALIGHSLGEYIAACIAGVFSLEDGLSFVMQRANLMQKVQRGGMDALNISEDEVKIQIEKSGCHLDIAAVNSTDACVVAGSFEELEKFEQYAAEEKISYSRLKTSHAFHSYMMESVLDDFAKIVDSIPKNEPKIAYISNLTGTWVAKEVTTTEYWCQHLRYTVRFQEGIKTLLMRKCVFLETGPGKVLSSLVRHESQLENIKAVCNMVRHPKEVTGDVEYLMKRIGELWCNGINVNFQAQYQGVSLAKLPLPGYVFEGPQFHIPDTKVDAKDRIVSVPDMFYRPCLIVRPAKRALITSDAEFLIVAETGELYDVLAKTLSDNGLHYSTVFYSNSWEERLQEFVASFSGRKKPVIVLNAVTYSLKNEDSCFWDLVRHVQILGNLWSVRYMVITNESRRKDELFTSLINGVCATAEKEYDNMKMVQLEVSQTGSMVQMADKILEECNLVHEGSFLKCRNGLRLEVDEEKIEIERKENLIRKNGNYVITGGLGGIGRTLCDYLLSNYHANVLLLARTPLPDESEWGAYLEGSQEDEIAERIKAVRRWREQDWSVSIQYCDICDKQETERIIYRFESLYGPVHGVYHTAGVKGDGLIRFKTKEMAMEVLKPKVMGTNAIEDVFAKRTLDFMMLFSSLATVTQEAGQSDYIAANCYLDAYADWATREYPNRKTISVHWDSWKSVGMAHKALLDKPERRIFFKNMITTSQAMEIMELALGSEEKQLIISAGNLHKRKQVVRKANQEELVWEALKANVKYDRPELSTDFIAPESEMEKHIAAIWAEAFSIKEVGIQDDFFELGGDSLYAIGVVNELKKYYQMDMTDIYNYPTIALLTQKLESRLFNLEEQAKQVRQRVLELKDLEARELEMKQEKEHYETLWKPYENLVLDETKEWKQILLLGGSGYLGIYLLKEIVMYTQAQVVLIVRPKEGMTGKERIARKFQEYFGKEMCEQYEDHWLVLDGDITKENFGLEFSVYWELAKSMECIINASGKVDHYGEYEAFRKANVESVKQIISFAKTGCKKEIHHMSTKGVATGKIQDRKTIFYTEFDTDYGQEFDNYYVDTKHQAEQLLMELRKEDIDVNLYRIGDIVYDSETGHFQENIEKNAVYLLMQSILNLECLPEEMPPFMEFCFVDFMAKAVVNLMLQTKLKNEIYHLVNPNVLTLEDLEEAISQAGFCIRYENGDDFTKYMLNHYDDAKEKEAIHNFLTYSHLLDLPVYTEFVLATEKTCCLLEKLGLEWKKPDTKSLGKMIQYGQEADFFPKAEINCGKEEN